MSRPSLQVDQEDHWPGSRHTGPVTTVAVGEPSCAPGARLGRKIRFEGLPADETHTLRIIGMDDGTCCVMSGIRAGTVPLPVRLVPGKTICGRLVIPAGTTGLRSTPAPPSTQ